MRQSAPVRGLHLQAAIIDLDGTMVDTLGDFVVALNAMLADLRLPALPVAQIATMIGKGSEHLIRSAIGVAQPGIAAADVDSCYPSAWASYQGHYLAVNGQHSALYPGVLEGLDFLRASGLHLACLTNKPTDFALPLLKSKGLLGYFSQVFGGDAFERKKPDPLPVIKTCQALGSEPALTLMVGDSSNDAKAAQAAGCRVALVGYGYNHGEPITQTAADLYLDSLAQLAKGH